MLVLEADELGASALVDALPRDPLGAELRALEVDQAPAQVELGEGGEAGGETLFACSVSLRVIPFREEPALADQVGEHVLSLILRNVPAGAVQDGGAEALDVADVVKRERPTQQ